MAKRALGWIVLLAWIGSTHALETSPLDGSHGADRASGSLVNLSNPHPHSRRERAFSGHQIQYRGLNVRREKDRLLRKSAGINNNDKHDRRDEALEQAEEAFNAQVVQAEANGQAVVTAGSLSRTEVYTTTYSTDVEGQPSE